METNLPNLPVYSNKSTIWLVIQQNQLTNQPLYITHMINHNPDQYLIT